MKPLELILFVIVMCFTMGFLTAMALSGELQQPTEQKTCECRYGEPIKHTTTVAIYQKAVRQEQLAVLWSRFYSLGVVEVVYYNVMSGRWYRLVINGNTSRVHIMDAGRAPAGRKQNAS